MEKEFVPYEPSLDLKELGFDEPCLGSFTLSKKKLQLLHYDNEMSLVQAPLYQQAFRWLYQKLEIKGSMPVNTESQIMFLNELIEIVKEKKNG